MTLTIASNMTRRSFVATLACAGALVLTGCGEKDPATDASDAKAASASKPSIKVGTMPTEDTLPMWVACEDGICDDLGLDCEVITFDSAQNLSAAFTAGEVDIIMTDPMRAAKLHESGVGLSMEWITLGTDASQGRFGVLATADSGYTALSDLVGCEKGVGVASNTVPEYVYEMLCQQAGVDVDDIPTQEVPSLPDRFGLLSSGNLDAAALPGSMLAFGEAQGMVILADDSQGDNISQSVMIVRAEFDETESGHAALELARKAWDEAARAINADPEGHREVLIAHANLNQLVADTYPISTYPLATTDDGKPARPAADLVEPQLTWMLDKGYLKQGLSYDEETGTFSAK